MDMDCTDMFYCNLVACFEVFVLTVAAMSITFLSCRFKYFCDCLYVILGD